MRGYAYVDVTVGTYFSFVVAVMRSYFPRLDVALMPSSLIFLQLERKGTELYREAWRREERRRSRRL